MFNIAIVGCGQLGSRYLEGMAALTTPIDITLVEPENNSFYTAIARWAAIKGTGSDNNLKRYLSCDDFFGNFDLVVVSTSARGRANVIENILRKSRVRYLIIEKVLAQSQVELRLISKCVENVEKAWVNTPRRVMPLHRHLGEKVSNSGPLRVAKHGGSWGLACNSIHFLDMVSWWTGERLLSVDVSGLKNRWFESKRPGYFEVDGRLVAKYSKGSELVLSSGEGSPEEPISIKTSNGLEWLLNERDGFATCSNGEVLTGRLLFQSQITESLVNNILMKGECGLPTFSESEQTHAVFLKAMRQHWNDSFDCNDLLVPIT